MDLKLIITRMRRPINATRLLEGLITVALDIPFRPEMWWQ
jgi:hypothetical protein